MKTIDMSRMTRGETDVLLGYDFGQRARKDFDLDELDKLHENVLVSFPEGLDTVTPSFAQGFFGKSVLELGGRESFYSVYDFSQWPPDLKMQVDAGIERALIDRSAAVHIQ